jgi:Fe-S-cluster containining protein
MSDETAAEPSICIGCGLCCDGTLFVRGKLTPDEASKIPAAHKVTGVSEGEQVSFRQPCVHFDGSGCRIYSDRYAACRKYRCEVLKAHEEGLLDSATARGRISEARDLIEAVTSVDPEAQSWAARRRLWNELAEAVKEAAGPERAALGRRLLNVVALDAFLDKHFRKKSDEGDRTGKA